MRRALVAGLLALGAIAGGCRRDMQDTPRYEPHEASTFFKDGRASRHLVAGTVARGELRNDAAALTGKTAEGYLSAPPFPLTRAVLEHGRERYDIYCSPCHDRAGTGGGMIVQRGYKPPPSLHEDRLRAVPLGYFFDVMTNGFGVMPSYAPQVPPDDRWAIAGYMRALQLSQHARIDDVPPDDRARLDAAAALAPPGTSGTGGRDDVQRPIGAGRAPDGNAPHGGAPHGRD
jgi:mono/diheme cytochrome c family protein